MHFDVELTLHATFEIRYKVQTEEMNATGEAIAYSRVYAKILCVL